MTKFLSDKFKVLSFISIILVLYIHSGFHDYPNEIQGMVFNTNLQNFISGMIGRCAVPLFYAISGYLFFTGLYDGGNANYPKLWFKIKKRGKTLLVPYIIACLFPVVFNLVLEFIPGIEQFVNNKGISKNFHQPIDKILNFIYFDSLLSGEILPQRKLPRTITFRNISSEVGLIKYIFDVASFEEDLTNRV